MASETWVTIGGFLATTASAIAAFFAVKQTMLQRTISTKPQIIINNQEVSLLHSSNNTFSLKIDNNDYYYEIPIFIKNVGLGTALNLKYNWSFDYIKNINLCGFKEIIEDPVYSHLKELNKSLDKHYHYYNDKNSQYEQFKFIRSGKLNYYGIKKEHDELEYLMPVAQEKSSSKIIIPSLIVLLLAELSYSDMAPEDVLFNGLEAGQLNIQYEDISGNKIKIFYNCKIQMIRYQSNSEKGPISTFKIEFRRIHSGSMPRLEKLRKSYADFLNEHDFNKNR